MYPCKHGAGPFAESASENAANALPGAFKSALFRWFHGWICCIKGLLHFGAVLPSLKGGEGNAGEISVIEDGVILYTR